MRPTPVLLAVSLLANLALGAGWLLREASAPRAIHRVDAPEAAPPGRPPTAALPAPAVTADAPRDLTALRDRLRALGFSESFVRAAVLACLESPRLARERAWRAAADGQPWWRRPTALLTGEQNREQRELRQAERAEIDRVLGHGGDIPPEEVERYAYFPAAKAARLAVLQRDYLDLYRELSSAPGTRAEIAERRALIDAERERDLATLLTPEERQQLELRTSNAAHSVSTAARYFAGTEADYLALFDLTKKHLAEMNGPMESRGGFVSAMERRETELKDLLGGRYAEWKQAAQTDTTALLELQRRFAVPTATTDAVAAVVRAVGDEGVAIADNRTLTVEQQKLALLELANGGRQRVIALLGPDLGDAYNVASSAAWLDDLERGRVPFILPNGQRAIRLVGHDLNRTRTVAPKQK